MSDVVVHAGPPPDPADPHDKHVPAAHAGTLEPNYYCRAWNPRRHKYCKARAGLGTTHLGTGRCHKHGGVVPGDARLRHGLARRRYASLADTPAIGALLERHADDPDPLNVVPELALARALLEDFVARYAAFAEALIAWHDTWEGKRIPIPEEEKQALLDAIDELEALIAERMERDGDEISEQARQRLDLARSAAAFLATPQHPKPRTILDISDAVAHVDKISKVIHRVETIRASGAISYEQLKRFLFAVERVIETRVRDAALVEKIREDLLAVRL